MPDLKKPPRKRLPKELAVIDPDNCTGCEACVEVCPVQCIAKSDQHPPVQDFQGWCEVDWDRCIGCGLCIRVPGKKSDPHRLEVCPWYAITMVPVERLVEAAATIGGPPMVAEQTRRRLTVAARRQVNLKPRT